MKKFPRHEVWGFLPAVAIAAFVAACAPAPVEPIGTKPGHAQLMRGMYSYMADSGWFTECVSGTRYPVAQEGANADLEGSYSHIRPIPGAPMLATVEGRLEKRVAMEGPERMTLIVDKFRSLEPQTCSGPGSTAQLENTYWKLMAIKGKRVETPPGAREIHLVLQSAGHSFHGFAGCNTFSGRYRLMDATLMFGNARATLMACGNGMDHELSFLSALPRVTQWKIAGETLQLLDGTGKGIATFESRYLR